MFFILISFVVDSNIGDTKMCKSNKSTDESTVNCNVFSGTIVDRAMAFRARSVGCNPPMKTKLFLF